MSNLVGVTVNDARPRQVIQGRHSRGVTQLAFSPDGKLLASASLDRSVRIWSAIRRDELRVIHRPTRDVSLAVAWSDAGNALLVSGFREASTVIDIATGKEIQTLPEPLPRVFQRIDSGTSARWLGRTPEGLALLSDNAKPALLAAPVVAKGDSKIGDFKASHDGSIVIAGSAPNGRGLFLWVRQKDGSFDVQSLPVAEGDRVGALTLTAGGEMAVAEIERANHEFHLELIKTAEGASPSARRSLPLPTEIRTKGVHHIDVSQDGSTIAAIGGGFLVVWDVAAMGVRSLKALDGAREPEGITRWEGSPVAISPDGRMIAAGMFDGSIELFSIAGGRYRGGYGAAAAVRAAEDLAFVGADTLGVLSSKHVTGWSVHEARVQAVEKASANEASEVFRIERGTQGGLVRVRFVSPESDPRCGPGKQRVFFDGEAGQAPICLIARPTESRGSALYDVNLSARRAIGIQDLDDGAALIDLKKNTSIPLAPRAAPKTTPKPAPKSPKSPRLAGSEPEVPCASPTNAALSPDGRLAAATGSPDGNTCVWDAATGERLLVTKVDPKSARRGFSNRVAFSPDGSSLAVARDSKVIVLAMPGGARTAEVDVGARALVLGFSDGGRALLVGGDDGSLMTLRGGAITAKGSSDGGALRAIRIDPSGKLAATVSDDGAARLWDVNAARLRASLASFEDEEWMAATPGGAYAGTLEVGDRIGWVFDAPVERFGFERYADVFLSPSIVKRRAAGEDVDTSVAPRRPPRLDIAEASGSTPAPSAVATLHAHVSSQGRVETVRVFANGRVIAAAAVCAREGDATLKVPLVAGRNNLTVVAFDERGFASNEVAIDMEGAPLTPAALPDVWVVAIGVSSYPALAPQFQLGAADDDARGIAAAWKEMEGRSFGKAHIVTLTDEAATPAAIRRAIADLSAMKPADLAVVFFAGHGVKPGAAADMVFLTGGPRLPETPPAMGLTSELTRRDGIGWKEIREALASVRGRVLVMLDACHSGHLTQEVEAPNEELAAALSRGERASVLVLAAAKGRQFSMEPSTSRGLELMPEEKPVIRSTPAEPHGYFTGALLMALRDPRTDRDGSGTIEASELFEEVKGRVTRLTGGAQTPWVAKRDLFGDFTLSRPRAP